MTEQEQISRLQRDKDIMYNNAKELQAENDYLTLLVKDIKDALGLDENADGYEIVVEVEKMMENR